MDSSNGTVARKLKVRNAVAGPTQTHRAEIAERTRPLDVHSALKIVGDVELDYYGSLEDPQDTEDHLAGSITVEPAGLFINGRNEVELPNEGGDPAVSIGWSHQPTGEPLRGNYVYISGKEIGIGPGQSPITGFAVTLRSSVKVPEVSEDQLDADVQVEGTVQSRKVDALSFGTDHVLGVGRASATTVEIGRHVEGQPTLGETRIKGQLKAEKPATFQEGATILGTTSAQGEVWANSLVVPGTARIEALSGNTVGVSTVNASTVNATSGVNSRVLVSQDGLICPSIAELKPEGCFHYVPASVRSDRGEVSTLAVEHLREENRDAALHVVNNSILPEGTGGYFRANRAIVAEGEVQINGRTVLNGEVAHASPVLMQGQPIIMGGGGQDEVRMICGRGRLEFYIGEKMTFYIDINGGHNA
jgi:hypothetical protein